MSLTHAGSRFARLLDGTMERTWLGPIARFFSLRKFLNFPADFLSPLLCTGKFQFSTIHRGQLLQE